MSIYIAHRRKKTPSMYSLIIMFSTWSFACYFHYQSYEHDIFKTNKPHRYKWSVGQQHETVNFLVRRSKVKVTRGKLMNTTFWKPILLQIVTSVPRGSGMKRSASEIEQSKVKFMGGQRYWWRPGRSIIIYTTLFTFFNLLESSSFLVISAVILCYNWCGIKKLVRRDRCCMLRCLRLCSNALYYVKYLCWYITHWVNSVSFCCVNHFIVVKLLCCCWY